MPALQAQSAEEIAKRVDQHYNQLRTLRANFTESYQGMGMHRSESGQLLLAKPGKMRWNYTAPAGKLFLLDGKFAWFYSKGDPHVQRLPAKQLDDLRSPLRFLLGHTQIAKELTGLTLVPAGQGSFTLSGKLKGQEQRLSRLTFTVTSSGAILAIEAEEADGALTRFHFSDEVANPALSDSEFRFNPPPGVPIVDATKPM